MNVALVIPTYNAAHFLPFALESALAQSAPPAEIIVVDDGSKDDTEEVVGRWRDRIKYVRQANAGVSVARNTGIAAIEKSSHVLFLDSDDCLAPDALRDLTMTLAGTTAVVAHGRVVETDEHGIPSGVVSTELFHGPVPKVCNQMFRYGGLPPGAFLVPVPLVRDIGGFDKRLSYAADLYFWLRCSSLAEFRSVDAPVLLYRIHGANMSRKLDVAMADEVDCRVIFQEWCEQRKLAPLDRRLSADAILSDLLVRFFSLRHWEKVEACLRLASARGLDSPAIRRIERLRKLPRWAFRTKDFVDGMLHQQRT
jgi:hypothetical protein